MIKSRLLVAALLSSMVLPVLAQSVPFDMTPESGLRTTTAPPYSTPANAQPIPSPPAVAARFEHYLLPSGGFRLTGEESRQASVVYLTRAQADAPARLQLSYINSVVVAPEFSQLAIRINGNELVRNAIASSSAPATISIDVPTGLLREGANRIEFSASQRHRTDCSVSSTFELWTEIDSTAARLSFEGSDIGQIRQLSDLAAIGVSPDGTIKIRLITQDLDDPEATRVAIELVQKLALALRVPNLQVEHATTLSETYAPGALDVIFGPAAGLPAISAQFGAQASAGAVAALQAVPSGANTLLVSGPDWTGVAQAADAILVAAPVTPDRPRIDLPYAIPTLLGGQSLVLSDLGVPTAEFNGRRHTAVFQFELPPDFYANRYGEAELVLDAAYSSDVLPGSEIDIYANGQIASATPLLRTDGGLLRDTVIRLPMRNLRPGRNEIEVVVNLNTRSDQVCSPGWTGEAPVRFVFSSSTQFRMPDYARAAIVPDLQALTGSAWPYADEEQVPLVLGRGTAPTMAAMTLLARAATASGKVLPVSVTPESQLRPDQNAIFVMPMPELSPPTTTRLKLAPNLAQAASNEAEILDQFRTGAGQSSGVRNFADWALGRVGLSVDDLRLLPRYDAPYPMAANSVMLAQSLQPEGGLWTVLTGPDNDNLLGGAQRLAVTDQWRQVGGRVSTLAAADTAVTSVETLEPKLVQTQPFSFSNMRLVAANWFSGNILIFSGVLAAAAILLMLATALMLSRVGRQK